MTQLFYSSSATNDRNSSNVQAEVESRASAKRHQSGDQAVALETGITAETLAAVASKKLAVGKSLTELFEENADSVLGLACASGYLDLVSALLDINANLSTEERNPTKSNTKT